MRYKWAVVGAGPAGIAAVGKLLDYGVAADDIVWLDPQFKVGDLGASWGTIPSNTKASLFTKFLNAAASFDYASCTQNFALHGIPPDDTCQLQLIVEPLQWVTQRLRDKVSCVQGTAASFSHDKGSCWTISLTDNTQLQAAQVILAVGATPKALTYPNIVVIPLPDALNDECLKQHLNAQDTVAVFGSSHSAILVLRNLVSHPVKIINFYRSPLVYAIYFKDWILFDNVGLKGVAAEWARQHIDGERPPNLMRVSSTEEAIRQYLQQCNKVIYAAGFERRSVSINGISDVSYDEQCGVIAPGLFGLGIAFPERHSNPLRMVEYQVGLWKFMDYLQRILPIWMKYSA